MMGKGIVFESIPRSFFAYGGLFMPSQARTVQELLQEANQLSPKEQLQLVTQLLLLVDQQLENPTTDTKPIARKPGNAAKAAAAKAKAAAAKMDLLTGTDTHNQEGSIDYLLAHPIPVRNFKPMSRDEIYDRG